MQRGYMPESLREVMDMVKQDHYLGVSVEVFGLTRPSSPKPTDQQFETQIEDFRQEMKNWAE